MNRTSSTYFKTLDTRNEATKGSHMWVPRLLIPVAIAMHLLN